MIPFYSPTLDEVEEFQALNFEGLETLVEVKTQAQIKREKWEKRRQVKTYAKPKIID